MDRRGMWRETVWAFITQRNLLWASLSIFGVMTYLGCGQEETGNVWHEPAASSEDCIEGCDKDGDLIADAIDNCPELSNSDQLDQDGDGRGDLCDAQPTTPNYTIRAGSIERTPRMSDGSFVLRTQTQQTLHRSSDGQYRLTVDKRP